MDWVSNLRFGFEGLGLFGLGVEALVPLNMAPLRGNYLKGFLSFEGSIGI